LRFPVGGLNFWTACTTSATNARSLRMRSACDGGETREVKVDPRGRCARLDIVTSSREVTRENPTVGESLWLCTSTVWRLSRESWSADPSLVILPTASQNEDSLGSALGVAWSLFDSCLPPQHGSEVRHFDTVGNVFVPISILPNAQAPPAPQFQKESVYASAR